MVELTDWANMDFKPEKSRSLVLKKGRTQDRVCFRINDTIVPMFQERPVKSLVNWYRADLSDKQCEGDDYPSRHLDDILREEWPTRASLRPGVTNTR